MKTEQKLLWKDFAGEECCDNCPLLKSEICPGGYTCYGGQPIEPPCCSFNDDTDLIEWVEEYFEMQRRREDREEERIKAEREKKERAKKAADTRRALKNYCRDELYILNKKKAELQAQLNAEMLARSWAESFNFANELFRYEERYQVNPEVSEHVKKLQAEVEKAEKAFQDKRAEFYQKRKIEAQKNLP